MGEDVDVRLDRLESLVEEQQATIEQQRDRIANLEREANRDSAETDDNGAVVDRRDALKAGGLLALLFGGVGTASADPQGQVGTSNDPLQSLHTDAINGGVTGGSELTSLLGDGLALSDGALTTDIQQVGSGTGVLDDVTSDNIEHRSLSGANGVTVSENGGTVTVGAGQTGVVTDTATSFTESGVKVNTTRASVSGGAVRATGNTSTASRPGDTKSFGGAINPFGVKIEPNVSLVGLVATISSNTSGATVKLTDSQLNTIQSKPFPGSGNTVNFDVPLSSGDKYYLLVDGSGYVPGYINTASYPYSSQYVDIITGRGADFDDPGAAFCISKVKAIATSETTIEFGDPTPVSRWETVTFQSRAGGGSVDVAVDVDDGGWSFWDYVGSGTDLSAISPDQNVRLRAEFTAGSVSDDPRLTFANRQYRP